MNKSNILIIGVIAAAFASTLAFAQSAKTVDADKNARGTQGSVQSDAEKKAERRARNEAAAAARPKAQGGKDDARVEEEEEERKKP